MGFFGDLKQDLSQAVNELIPEGNEEKTAEESTETVEGTDTAADASDIDLEKMLDEAIGGDIVAAEEPASDDTGADTSEAESAVADAFSDMEKTADFSFEESGYEESNDTSFKGVSRKMDSNTNYSEETSVITLGMIVKGDITTEGSLEILGDVNGNIDVRGKLNITGHVTGNSSAREVFAENAKITGDVSSESSIKIGAGTVIVGNITGFSAAVAGAVKGDIDVHGPVILDSSAIVMGNIRSKSVQINNGAAIEGSVSQCYADVSPTSFFDDYKPETAGGKKSNKSDKN
ncbi:MAG: polymer-forming cytoskeletal protein [Lachnospiraceae bacterium]|nr:polymer-forming cytoskeletal protein [Lachnospiraceae bacterium]